ncbi:MAG: DUF4838 domain-containing protein [Bacteroidales bacterium]
MKNLVIPVFFILILGFVSCLNEEKLILVDGGPQDYSIIVSATAQQNELKAAYGLRKYIEEMSGVELNIITDVGQLSAHEILIGNSNRIDSPKLLDEIDHLDKDGFVIKTIGDKLLIAGGDGKGTLYGVYSFLEEHLGCRRYSSEVSVIPTLENIVIGKIDDKQEPAFEFRELHMPGPRSDASFRDWHKLDFKEGENEWGMFVHTFDDFIPYDKYFKTHPEYFSYLNVQRIPDGQLCLSNPDVFNLVVEDLKVRMREKPKALYWSVSQNDTYKPCECSNCRKEYEEYGGYSGAMVHFVNNVAAEFPDKAISTLAYQYTRSAPTNIKPADNVNIMFCSIECNRSRPLSSDPLSASFRKDMEDWCELTDNIFMWDYVVQFRSLISPFPNFNVLQPNIKYFRDNGIQMMFQQGSGGLISEFVELRTYIIAKLLWNPDANAEAIMDDFLLGYYGPAGKYLRQYIDLMHEELAKSGGDLGIYGYPYDGINTYLTPELITKYEDLFDQAEKSVKDSQEYMERVKVARLPIEFAILDISLRDVNEDFSYFTSVDGKRVARKDMLERLERFTKLAKEAGITRYWEHGNYPDDYKETIERFVSSSLENHLALGKPVRLLTEYSEKYPVGGANALTDGLKGINDYHFNWLGFEGPHMVAIIDLEKETNIHSIECDFLQEIKSWVFLPEEVQFLSSANGGDFQFLGSVKNSISENREGTFIETFKLEFEPVKSRFIKVAAKNKGICPDWHPGATYPAWIFCDEVIII